jgi:hypothetical protein
VDFCWDLPVESKVWFNVMQYKDKAIAAVTENDLSAAIYNLVHFILDDKDFEEFTQGYVPRNTLYNT